MVYGKMFFFIILTLIFCYDWLADVMPYVSLADVFAWQVFFAFRNVAHVIAMRKMLSSYF